MNKINFFYPLTFVNTIPYLPQIPLSMASRRTSLKVKLFVLVRGMEAHLVKLSAMRLLFVLVGSLFLLDSVSGVTLTIPVEAIFPNNKHMLEQANIFLNKTTDQSKVIIAKELAGLGVPVKAFVLQNLVKASQHAFNDPHAMFEVDLDTLRELIKKYEEYKPTDRPPVNVEKIYPENLDLQDKVRDFLDQLSKDSQDLVGEYLGNRTSEQQGRVLLELAKPINPVLNNVTLDAETIKKAIELDERNQSKSTEEVPTTAPTTDTTPKMTSSAKTPSPHTLENLFPAKPDIQEHVEKFWYNLTPASQTTLRNSVCNLKPEKQRRILVYLTRVSEARTNQNGEKMMLHNDSVEKVVLMDDKGELGEAQKIIDDGKWPDEPLDDGSIDGSGSSGRIVHVACLSILAVVWLIV
ncbi:hypothetical protein PPYR_03141 [Photinus pyralis]|uniref:Uncharacterized protein n=1 Tax=Photinus pyralis TaxID=7054 RepID=A0A5N4A219_PHOPY|nr:hypothetical protein PPYR_03141 [Photinus pyralis]